MPLSKTSLLKIFRGVVPVTLYRGPSVIQRVTEPDKVNITTVSRDIPLWTYLKIRSCGHSKYDYIERARREVENNVQVEITEVPTDPVFSNLKCGGLDNTNLGVVKLVNGRRTITCTVELVPDRNDFEKVIGINLKYNVLDSKDTTILVKHLADAP